MAKHDPVATDRSRNHHDKKIVARKARDVQKVLDGLEKRSLGKPVGAVRLQLEIAMKARGLQLTRADLDQYAQELVDGTVPHL